MSSFDAHEICTTCLTNIRSAQAALRFECLRSGRDGMRAQLLYALAGLSQAEALLLDALCRPIANWHQTFIGVRKWSKKALNVTETYFHDFVEAPGLSTNLAIILERLPAEPEAEVKEGGS